MKVLYFYIGLLIEVMFIWTVSAYDFTYDAGDIEGSKSSTGITYTLNVSKGNLETAYDFDTKAGVTSGAPAGIDIRVSSGGASGTMEYANDSLPASNFTISMNGKLIPPTGGSGSQPTWGASGNAKAPFHIQSDQNGGEKEIVVPHGTSVKYSAYKGTSLQNSTWSITGFPSKDGEEIRFNKSFWASLWPWSAPNITDPEPGVYNISATAKLPETGSDSGRMTVVGVERIEVKIRNGNYKIPDTITYVAVGDSFSVKAFPTPAGTSWPTGTPEWSTSGDSWFSSVVSGVGEEKTVNTSNEIDGFYIVATCGTSEKRIEVKIYQCNFVVYVQAPIGGPIGISDVFSKEINVGHAFWELKVSNFALDYLKKHELEQYAKYLNNKYGFYPQIDDFLEKQTGPGVLGKDNSHSYDKSKKYNISYKQLVAGLSATKSLDLSPGIYTLGTRIIAKKIPSGVVVVDFSSSDDRNCTTVCKAVANRTGISLPNSFIANWTTSTGDWELHYSGNCPYVLKNNL